MADCSFKTTQKFGRFNAVLAGKRYERKPDDWRRYKVGFYTEFEDYIGSFGAKR
jgi:hypothetical protein